jgi:hypothetical protein
MARLNGWQRLWVVLTVLWGGLIGLYTWIEWPQESERRIRTYTIKENSSGNLFDVRWYGDSPPPEAVVNAIGSRDKRYDAPPKVGEFWADEQGHVVKFASVDGNNLRAIPVAEAVEVDGVGLIQFPSGTSDWIKENAVKEFMQGVWPRRNDHLKQSAWLLLIPTILLYGSARLSGGSHAASDESPPHNWRSKLIKSAARPCAWVRGARKRGGGGGGGNINCQATGECARAFSQETAPALDHSLQSGR